MAETSQWSPSYTKSQTRDFIKSYEKNPSNFSPQGLESVRQHAQYHNVPFYEGDFSIIDAIKYAGAGFLEGFTTLNVSKDTPDNAWEAVAKSVGHLAGFAPGILAGPLKFLGMTTKSRTLLDSAKFLQGKKGIPLYVAEKYITPRAAKVANAGLKAGIGAKSQAFQDAAKFLSTGKAKHIAEGAFNLGTASAISAWQGGVDVMLDSFFHGAIAGGVFRGIGNQINMQDPKAEKFARGLAGSLFMGLPATARGASTPEQVYEYLMGAYFGGSEKPWTVAKAMPIAQKVREKAEKSDNPIHRKTYDPRELYEGWEKVEPEVQKEVLKITSGPGMAGGTPEEIEAATYELYRRAEVEGMAPKMEELQKSGKDVRSEVFKVADKIEKEVQKQQKQIIRESIKEASKPDPTRYYVMTTGETGTQAQVLESARKRDISSVETKFPDQVKTYGKPNESITIERKYLVEANKGIDTAIENLNKAGEKVRIGRLSEYAKEGMRRDFVNVKFSDQIISVDKVNDKMTATKGLSKYAIQMGIDAGKEVYVYDKTKQWLKYDKGSKKFITTAKTPELSPRVAFFGKKAIDIGEKQAIESLFQKWDKMGFKAEIDAEIDKKQDILDIETNDVRDAGEFYTSPIDNKMSYFMQTYLRPELKKTIKSSVERDDMIVKISKSAGKLAPEYIERGSTKNRSPEWVEAIEQEFNMQLPTDLKGKMRQWIAVQNQGEAVRFINTDGKKVELTDKENPYTMGGKSKLVIEPPKEFEYAILDALTYKGVDYDLSKFEYATRREGTSLEQKAIKKDFISNTIKKMGKKGYHPYGGVGDKDRIIFVKYHPNYKKTKKVNLPPSIYKTAKDLYGMNRLEHDNMMKSIIAYQEQLNGMPINKMINNPGFIQNAVADNKRAQIWMTNGIKGDKEFINNPKYTGADLKLSKIKLPDLKIVYSKNIKSTVSDRFVSAQTDKKNRAIKIDKDKLREDYDNKVWIKPKVKGVNPLPENIFKSYKSWEDFVIRHEKAHFLPENEAIKNLASRENHANEIALGKRDGNYKGSLIADPVKIDNILKALNVKLPQHVDGAIIATDAVVDAINLDAGVPYTGSNKSFIISKNPKGTILGKYMIHKAGPDLTKAMEKANNGEGVNFLMMESAIKQTGDRIPGDYNYIKGKPLELIGGAKEIIEINPGDLRYSHSVINDHKMLGKNEAGKPIGITFVKQMLTNLHPDMYSKVSQETIDNLYNEIAQRSFDGKTEYNKLVDSYLEKPSDKILKDIIENFDDVGIKSVEKVLKSPGSEKLAQEMLLKILKTNKESLEMSRNEGENSGTQAEEQSRNLVDFYSTADNIIKHLSKMEDAYPMFFDKYTKDYVHTSIDRFVAERVLRPKMKNAIVARMRPYDKSLQEKFPELNKKDDIFYLGDLYKDTPMYTNIPRLEKTTLGKLWSVKNMPEFKKYKQEFDDIFEAINVRVPQDSPSGAQVKRFAGFTGIKDHGVLSHGRSMEAQGGADLDGDESFIYFGGRHADGTGEGMKKSWKDMYKAQKEEFYTKDKTNIKDAKTQYRDKIVISRKDVKDRGLNPDFLDQVNKNPLARFSPAVRMFVGQEHARSRGKMGPVVGMTSHMRAAWSSLKHSNNKFDVFEKGIFKDGVKYRTILEPKEASAEQRDLSKALVNFTADPANETGLIEFPKMQSLLREAYFKITPQKYNEKTKKWINLSKIPTYGIEGKTQNHQRYNDIRNFNAAYFSRNWDLNRGYTPFEKKMMGKRINNYDSNEMTTSTMKFANTLRNVDMDISLFKRIDFNAYKKLYNKHEVYAKKLDFYKQLLGRTKLVEEPSKQVDFILKNDLFIEENIKSWSKDGKSLIKELGISKIRHNIKDPLNEVEVEGYLRKLLSDSQDYLSNAFHNMTTLDRIVDIYEKSYEKGEGLTNELMAQIRAKVEEFKSINAYQHKMRSNRGEFVPSESTQEVNRLKDIKSLHEALNLKSPINLKGLERRTKLVDNATLDNLILKYKESLPSESARDVFDNLYIGSLRSPEMQKSIDKYMKMPNKDKLEKITLTDLYKQGAKTNTTKAAFDSKVVSSKNIMNFFKTKNKYYLKSMEPYKEVDIESFEKEIDPLINKRDIRLAANITNDIDAYQGIKKGNVEATPENKKIVKELFENLKFYSDAKGKDISQLLSGIYSTMHEPFSDVPPKTLNQMNIKDYKLINNYFKFVRSGNMFQQMEKHLDNLKKAGLKRRHHLLFPKQIDAEMLSNDMKFLPSEGYFQTKDGIAKIGKMYRPTYYGEVLQNWISRTHDLSYGKSEELIRSFQDSFKYLNQTKDGDAMWRLAVRKSELKQFHDSGEKIYEQNWKDSQKNNNYFKIRNKNYVVELDGVRKKYNGHELIDYTMNKLEGLMENYHSIIRGRPGALSKYRTGWYDPDKQTQPILDYKSFINDLDIAYKKGQLLSSKDKKVDEFLGIGVDGMRHMTRSMFIDLLPPTEYTRFVKGEVKKINTEDYWKLSKLEQAKWRPDKEAKAREYEDLVINSTGYRKGYFPHYFHSKKKLKQSLKNEKDMLLSDKTLTKQEKQAKIQKLITQYKTRIGDWDFADYKMWNKLDADLFKETLTKLEKKELSKQETTKLPSVNMRFGNMFARDNHMGGWMVDPTSVEVYIRNLTNTYFRQMGNLVSRYTLHNMREHMNKKWVTPASQKDKKEAREMVKGWVTFWKKYASEAMGNPVMLSQAELDNPNLKLKGTPYSWFADNLVAKKLNKIGEKLGLIKDPIKEIDITKKQDKDIIIGGLDAYNIRSLANTEGKYQLATLMTHPKTMINNVFGGTMHTFQSVGYEPLRKARDISFLQTINPKWKNKEAINDFVADLGIQPEFLQHEFGLHKEFREGKGKAFANELIEISKSDAKVKDIDFTALSKKYGITDAVMKKAAAFMTIPERMLRRDSFMAHYIKAWERFGGSIQDPNHPYLIEIAKKGVKATQFLYNAPFRPAFARSGLGKIMSRFQLWSWNAVRFRNDIRKQARLYGYTPGTEAMKRFERTMTTDLFVLALSSVFMYSLFEQVLPAPWNWLQDTSEWLFGDEKERDRAFFGTYPRAVAPLQMITPPIARFPISVIREFAEDDYTKLSDYYMWTMFPFGRMIRDVAHPETGLLNNPLRLPEKVVGFPLTGMAREAKRIRESDYTPPTPGMSLY